jgi:hypothetical protein
VPSLPTRLPDDPSPRKIRADQLQGLAMIATLGFGLWQGAVALSSPAGQRQFDGKLGFEDRRPHRRRGQHGDGA